MSSFCCLYSVFLITISLSFFYIFLFDVFCLPLLDTKHRYLNGRDSKFATSFITDSLFVGTMYGAIETPESPRCAQRGLCQGLSPGGDTTHGYFYPTPSVMGDGWSHAIHLPGIGSEVEVKSSSFFNYQAAFFGCAWCSAHRGGYEMGFENVSLVNVEHVAHFKHGVGGIIVDRDGSLTGFAGGTVVPPTGQVWKEGRGG